MEQSSSLPPKAAEEIAPQHMIEALQFVKNEKRRKIQGILL
jgi:hypothetical protein